MIPVLVHERAERPRTRLGGEPNAGNSTSASNTLSSVPPTSGVAQLVAQEVKHVLTGDTLKEGFGVGINTDAHRTNWLKPANGSFRMAYRGLAK